MNDLSSDELFMAELKQEFFDKTSESLKQLPGYFQQGDFEEIKKIAHDIKGTAGLFGLDEGSEIGRKLQLASEENDRSNIEKYIEALIVYMKEKGVSI